MRLAFEFTSKPNFESVVDTIQAMPVELLIENQGNYESRRQALQGYILTLDYLFRGVSNYAVGEIFGVSVENSWFGKMSKRGDLATWDAVVDKHFLVVYDISHSSLREHMYVADSLYFASGNKSVSPVWLTELLDPKKKAGSAPEDHIRYAVSVVTEYVDTCELTYGLHKPNELAVISKKTGKPISVADIENNDDFSVVQLLSLLLGKGLHQGVFLINARNFTDKALMAFSDISRLFFGNTFFFIYNVDPKSKLSREVVTLPNYRVTK